MSETFSRKNLAEAERRLQKNATPEEVEKETRKVAAENRANLRLTVERALNDEKETPKDEDFLTGIERVTKGTGKDIEFEIT